MDKQTDRQTSALEKVLQPGSRCQMAITPIPKGQHEEKRL